MNQSIKALTIAMLACSACVVATQSSAQTQPQPQPQPQSQSQGQAQAQDVTPDRIASAGAEVIKLADQSRFADLWVTASPMTKQLSPQAAFSAELVKARQPLGEATARSWVLVSRRRIEASQGAIAGQYLNIEYETRFSRGDFKHELVSFRLDEDKIWRFAGYTLR